MSQLHVSRHPLTAHHLRLLRSIDTDNERFRRQVDRLATILTLEATADLSLQPVTIQTPLEKCESMQLSQSIAIVPILRAGLGMVPPLLQMLPQAQVQHLGMYRDEATALPVEYYSKLSTARGVDIAIVTDPMLATGGSALAAIDALKRWGATDIRLLCLIAAPEGIDAVLKHHNDVRIFVSVVDRQLTANKFIAPGLGDAGDRMFGT